MIISKFIVILKNLKEDFMSKGSSTEREETKLNNAVKYSEESRGSSTGYLERGNDTNSQAKARVLRNRDNGSHE